MGTVVLGCGPPTASARARGLMSVTKDAYHLGLRTGAVALRRQLFVNRIFGGSQTGAYGKGGGGAGTFKIAHGRRLLY